MSDFVVNYTDHQDCKEKNTRERHSSYDSLLLKSRYLSIYTRRKKQQTVTDLIAIGV